MLSYQGARGFPGQQAGLSKGVGIIAAYYAIYGTAHVYRLTGQGGHNEVYPDGINAWACHGHHQQYLTLANPTRLTTALDSLVDAQPTA